MTGTDKIKVSAETERTVRDFVRTAVTSLGEKIKGCELESEVDLRWERGTDGSFRERKKRVWLLSSLLGHDWLDAQPNYQTCVEQLKSDTVFGSHIEHLVGTYMGSFRLEAGHILASLIRAMFDDEGHLTFSEDRYDSKWRELIDFLDAEEISFITIAPLPHLSIEGFPLRLNKDLILDRMTDEEVTRCYQVGVIRPISMRFMFILPELAVGIRRRLFLPKLIQTPEEPYVPPESGEGSFGNRPALRDDLVVGDVLSALRLFKHSQIRKAGYVKWSDSWLQAGTSFRIGEWPYWGNYELSAGEVPQFLRLWQLLEEGAARFGFSIHRFNLAFDRGLLADRIVDLVIAAESLFLGDLPLDRGELRFRFALRAAKFVEHPSYSEHDIVRLMRRAYDARSAVVHGGSPSDTRLPDKNSAELPAFLDTVEEIVRLSIRKAL
jgi:Apea-like HEPN